MHPSLRIPGRGAGTLVGPHTHWGQAGSLSCSPCFQPAVSTSASACSPVGPLHYPLLCPAGTTQRISSRGVCGRELCTLAEAPSVPRKELGPEQLHSPPVSWLLSSQPRWHSTTSAKQGCGLQPHNNLTHISPALPAKTTSLPP